MAYTGEVTALSIFHTFPYRFFVIFPNRASYSARPQTACALCARVSARSPSLSLVCASGVSFQFSPGPIASDTSPALLFKPGLAVVP